MAKYTKGTGECSCLAMWWASSNQSRTCTEQTGQWRVLSLSLSSLFSLCLCLSWDRAGCARVGFPQASGTPHLHCRHAPSLLLCQARVRCAFLLYQLSHTRPFADNAVLFAESFSLSLSFFVFSLTFSNAVEVTVPFSNPSF